MSLSISNGCSGVVVRLLKPRRWLETIGLLSIACFSEPTLAQTCSGVATLSWQAPTLNEDGSPLTNLRDFKVYWGSSQGTYPNSVSTANTGYIVTGLCPGTWYFAATAFNTNDLESEFSMSASKAILPDPIPSPPILTTLGGEAFLISQVRDRIVLVPVGTVPADVSCDSNQAVKDANGILAYQVPRDSVTWYGTVTSEVVFSRC